MAKTEKAPPLDRTIEDRIDELHKRRRSALQPGGRDAAQRQHDKGKLTARERLGILMDVGSFVETDPFGDYEVGGLTAGKYTFTATNPGCQPATAKVTVIAGTTIEKDFVIPC